ncbi:squalene synthase HpnC [soil metagenome]
MWDFAAELRHHGSDTTNVPSLAESQAYCQHVTTTHYENFTVVSLLLPRKLRPQFQAIYAWCRWADDLADETAGGEESLRLLAWWRDELAACYADTPRHIVTVALAVTVKQFAIPQQLFLDLINAFEQDQRVKEYDTFEQLLDYCRRSANPVGRLVLHLFECCDDERGKLSDEVCTGLQLANFWQDVQRDAAMGRVYLPQEDRDRFTNHRDLIRFEVDRTRGYFERGRALLPLLPRCARIDVTLFISGGEAILDAIAKQDYDVLTQRPTITKWKKMRLLLKAVIS